MGWSHAALLEEAEQKLKRWPQHKREWVQKQRKVADAVVTASRSARGIAANFSRMHSKLPSWKAGVGQRPFVIGLSGNIYDGVCQY